MTFRHYRTFLAISLLVVWTAGLQACSPKPRAGYSDIQVSIMDPKEAKCDCDNAERYQVANNGTRPGKLIGWRYERLDTDPENVVKSYKLFMPINAGKKEFLECSIIKDAKKICNTLIAYELDGNNYPSPIGNETRKIVIKTVKVRTEPLLPDANPTNACVNACTGTGDCKTIDLSHSTDVGVGLEIAAIVGIMDSQGTIGIQKIMELTKGGKNECLRTDVVFENGVGYNYGNQCEMPSKLPDGSGVTIVVPPNFVTTLVNLGAGDFELKFMKSKAAPQVNFDNTGYQNLFGGSIKQINFYGGKYIVQNWQSKCFALKLR